VRFEREWGALRAYAAERGVRLIGDLPIYVSGSGADVAGWPELFERGEVAGAPPDALSASGQLWGNPLYDWPVHRATGFRWWRERFRRTFELVDLCRVDHFRGFVSYWAIPAGHKTAKRGHWRPGPGRELFDAVKKELGSLPLIAEDLGRITPPVYRLRDELGLPGMAVLLWAFGRAPGSPHRPENIVRNEVAYTSIHDTDTVVGFFKGKRSNWELIELAYASRASLAVVPAQDVLGLGSEARMNRPGTAQGNWQWRLHSGQLTPALARRLRELASKHNR
jgi:4-alpha-glucanotransferase